MNFLKVFLAFLFLGGLLLLKTDAAEASRWGPRCSSAPLDHQRCPSGNTPDYATTRCIDSVNIVGGVVQRGLTPAIGNVRVTVKAAAAQLVCNSVQCLRREDTQDVTVTPNNGASNPASFLIDTLGCSGGNINCNDTLTLSIVSIDKGGYTSCTPRNTVTERLDINGQTINPLPLNIICTPPAPTSTPLPPRPPPCPIPSGLIGADGYYGDVDGDGSITLNDVDKTSRIVARISATQAEIEAADVNDAPNVQSAMDDVTRDVTSADTALILQYINGIISSSQLSVCQEPTPTLTPTPTTVPTNTPTPIPACNVPCVRDSYCAGARDGCTDCGTSNTCQRPPTPIPTSVPTTAPTSTPTPTNIPPPTASPTPAFNPAACKCDSIQYTGLFSGQPVTITSFAKVLGSDITGHKVVNQKFFLTEGAGDLSPILAQSGPILARIVENTTTKVRYQSDWSFVLPQLKAGATYKIFSIINCQPKTTAFNTQPAQSASVLATETQNLSLLDRIFEFFNGLFGGGSSTVPALTPTITPFTSADTTTSDVLATTVRNQLQLEPIYPLEVYQKTCSFIKFRSGQFAQ